MYWLICMVFFENLSRLGGMDITFLFRDISFMTKSTFPSVYVLNDLFLFG